MAYIRLPMETDADEIAEQGYQRLSELVPGWEPSDGNLDVWLLQVMARQAADLGIVLTDVGDELFRYLGEALFGIPPHAGTSASGLTTWTMLDEQAYTIPAGTGVGINDPEGTLHEFATVADVVVSASGVPGTPSSISGVVVAAVEPGVAASNIDATAGGAVVLLDPLGFVVDVVGENVTTGGTDPETDEAYMDRLREELMLMAPRPITASDFAVLARRHPGVGYSWAIDGYEPGPPVLEDQQRTVTVVVADPDCNPCSPQVMAEVEAALEAQREVGFIVHVIPPVYVDVDVAVEATAYPGWDEASVEGSIEDAVRGFVSPASFAADPLDAGDQAAAFVRTAVRFGDVIAVVDVAFGVDYVSAVQIGPAGGPLGPPNTDYELPGSEPVRLPRVASVTATVTVPVP